MKKLCSEPFRHTRDLVIFVNEKQIPKEDIVQILPLGDQIFLIYYR